MNFRKTSPYFFAVVALAFSCFSTKPASAGTVDSCVASGGTVSTYGNYCVHTFTSSGTFKVPTGLTSVDVLVVGGGGGGGSNGTGGGGAGGYRFITNLSVSAQAYNVTVGSGGSGGVWGGADSASGEASQFSTIIAAGGGCGAEEDHAACSGGSGGGGVYINGTGGNGNTPATDPSQGNNGGDGYMGNGYYNSAGGGGAGEAGFNGPQDNHDGGNGGDGTQNSITGSLVYYAGGGAAGGDNYRSGSGGQGGLGGGGNGGTTTTGDDGQINTGGGGGGGTNSNGRMPGGNGGSGIVIIRYAINQASDVVNSPLQLLPAKISSWSASQYTDQTSCSDKLKLFIDGKHFHSDTEVRINGVDADSVNVKYSRKLSATFCLADLLNAKIGRTRNIYVQNPHTDSSKASKSIHLDSILPQLSADGFTTQTADGITNIQKVLVKLNYLDSQYITGLYGPITTQAIQKFQADNNLPQTGHVGPLTMVALADKMK